MHSALQLELHYRVNSLRSLDDDAKKSIECLLRVHVHFAVIIALDLVIDNARNLQTSPRSVLRHWNDKVGREAEIKKDRNSRYFAPIKSSQNLSHGLVFFSRYFLYDRELTVSLSFANARSWDDPREARVSQRRTNICRSWMGKHEKSFDEFHRDLKQAKVRAKDWRCVHGIWELVKDMRFLRTRLKKI